MENPHQNLKETTNTETRKEEVEADIVNKAARVEAIAHCIVSDVATQRRMKSASEGRRF